MATFLIVKAVVVCCFAATILILFVGMLAGPQR